MRFISEMEEGAAATWESLDDDDDDAALLHLRPCKRQQINLQSHNTSSSQPIILSPSHSSTPHSLTLHYPHSQFQPTPPPSTSIRSIPGPAGAVKAAMLRRSRASYPNPRGAAGDDPPIPTQEYIRRVVENGDVDDDDDFKSNPWLCALQFLGPQETLDGRIPITPLSSIKKCLDIGRADQVVAVIKSCTQNGLGDLMVTLKDPTGTVDASIHHKVLAKFGFGKEISVGSVLILQKVAVFAPSQSACYLNITLNNVVKVISKDSGPPLKQNYPVSAIKRVVPGNECVGETNSMHKAFSFELDKPEMFMDDTGQCSVRSSSAHNDKLTEKRNHPLPLGGHCSSSANRRDQNEDLAVKEPTMTVRQDVAREILNKARRMDDTIDDVDDDDDVDKRKGLDDVNGLEKEGSNSLSSLQKAAYPEENLVRKGNDQESWRIINGVKNQKHSMTSRPSLPEWTDEQLNELFGADSEDHDSLF